ncbi:proline-rich protein 12-like isoform X2 [Aricia agestis]|uniref:proline-rich protein 12-like isoform X2 n=1 Tax=Aricia agestis TaxID=91739 RepID=UPI001C209A88|nr:proline-rich protein 12-like isoform X2 [Aricia agestis]
MDPVGPWSAYAQYNRLAGVQAGAASGDFHHHLASGGSGLGSQSVPSTTSQLLLQAAHTTASLAGQLGSSTASPFNPGGFLSPPAVGYDAVFSPLFHHANPKPAHYSSSLQAQHRQVIAQAQAAAASKQTSVESELSSLRENYSHQTLATQGTFFDQSATPGGATGLSWQGNNQLPSPFGILPHESVVPSSPSPATTKSSATYENFNAHFAAAQTLNNHLNSQIASSAKQSNRSGSPATASKQPTSSSSSTFFQSPSFGNQSDNYSSSNSKSGQLSSQQDYAGKQRGNTASTVAPTSQQQSINNTAQDSKVMEKKFNVPVTGPGSGFMASYLKFLQGERDTSPPPAGRGARKSTWSRSNTNSNTNTNNKPYTPNEHNKPHCEGNSQQNSNGAMASTNALSSGMSLNSQVMSSSANMSAIGLLGSNQLHGTPANLLGSKGVDLDDPRYYHLKDRKRKYDGTDESSYDPDEEARRLNKPVLNVPTTPLNDKGKKGRTTNPIMSKPTPAAVVAPQPAAPKKPRVPIPPPVAALQPTPQQQYYYQHQPEEVSAHAAGLGYGVYGSDNDSNSNRKLHHIKSHQQISSTGQIDSNRPVEEMPYQSGEFVAIKSELNELWPAIWRVDGRTLLQKYEPFEENGKVLYRNISTYAAWNPENKKLYTQVPVKVRSQSHLETIVELIRSELPLDDCNFIEKRMLETQMYQENFEVYIQTLISHALDPNFLTEIFQEKDEYFLSNVKTVDEVTDSMRARVSCGGAGGGARALDGAAATWPGLSVSAAAGTCRACARPAAARLLLYGQPYNPATLEPIQPDARLAYEKDFLVCSTCCGRVQLYSRISHQKYLMYAECSKRVTEKRMQNPNNDTTAILNELLADEVWLSQLFRDVRHSWAEAESWDRKMRQAMSRQMI